MGAALLELCQYVTKCVVRPDDMNTTPKNLYKASNGNLIFRIYKNKILDKE